MRELLIDRRAVSSNLAVVKTRAGSAAIYVMLGGNARGADALEIARICREEGITRFCITSVEEAELLRQNGFETEDLLMLRTICDSDQLERLIDLNVQCSISSPDSALALNGLAERRSTVVEAHVHIDSGMGRGGYPYTEPDKILSAFQYLSNVAISGVYTRLSPENHKRSEQLARFHSILEQIRSAGFETGTVHAADSSAILHCPESILDAVRAGSVLFGRTDDAEKSDGLTRIGLGRISIDEIRWLPKNYTLEVGRTIRLKKPTRVALLPVGQANGFGLTPPPKGFFSHLFRRKKITVRIGNSRVSVIGTPGMFETLIDVTKLNCSAGDVVTFAVDPILAFGLTKVYS